MRSPACTHAPIWQALWRQSLVYLLPAQLCASELSNGLASDVALESMMQTEVTTAFRAPLPLSHTPAAAYIITREDILRSGANSIPEALRLAPGVEVAQISPDDYSVTIRGFGGRNPNKLLVLVDGRSIYNTTFNGIYWPMLETPVEDIERIEVIRGPGTSQWGSNAVNGVINILTMHSDRAGGSYGHAVYSNTSAGVYLSHGGELNSNASFRTNIKLNTFEPLKNDAFKYKDNAIKSTLGFRIDSNNDRGDQSMVSANMVRMNQAVGLFRPPIFINPDVEFLTHDMTLQSWNVAGNWTRSFDPGRELKVSGYLDRYVSEAPANRESVQVSSVDINYTNASIPRHRLLTGAGLRLSSDRLESSDGVITLSPESDRLLTSNLYIQDEYQWLPERLVSTLGTKLEHNDYTGLEWQPQLRLLWHPHRHYSLWGSVSRAVRTPSRRDRAMLTKVLETDSSVATLPVEFDGAIYTLGNSQFNSETLVSTELGLRFEPSKHVSIDVAAYRNYYDNLYDATITRLSNPGHEMVLALENGIDGNTHGVEASMRWSPSPSWRAHLYGNIIAFDLTSNIDDPRSPKLDLRSYHSDASPSHQYGFSLGWTSDNGIETDITMRHVESISYWPFTTESPVSPSDEYDSLGLSISWKPNAHTQISLSAKNLNLPSGHTEFYGQAFGAANRIPRAIQLSLQAQL